MSKLDKLREFLKAQELDAFIIPSNDAFGNEFVPLSERRLGWITGFRGSNGTAVITLDNALFFTDGRYTIQAKREVQGFEIYDIKEISPYDWINQNIPNEKIGFDVWLHTEDEIKKLKNPIPLEQNPIDKIWADRPVPEIKKIIKHELKYAGKSSLEKRQEIAEKMISAALIITAPDSLCWLLNIRGFDIPYTPFCLCYGILYKNTDIDLYIDLRKIPDNWQWEEGINAFDINKIKEIRDFKDVQLSYAAAYWFNSKFPNAKKAFDPCQMAKAVKNEVEIEGIKNSHIKDGIAVTKFLKWLEQQEETTELDAAKKLEEFRKEQDLFISPSFSTTSAFGDNGAMTHYSGNVNAVISRRDAPPSPFRGEGWGGNNPSKGTLPLAPSPQGRGNGLYLFDSGGQYLDGTTDITRTIAIGEPTEEQKHNFTLVLKGHIALARAVFPEGTTGFQLDSLARYYLWQNGLDYGHGTGHGVGYFLSVHEFPPNITRKNKTGADMTLKAGMILSNEPGCYKEGEYGIRIENMMLVVKSKYEGFLEFETLTKVPIDKKLIDYTILNNEEKTFIEKVF